MSKTVTVEDILRIAYEFIGPKTGQAYQPFLSVAITQATDYFLDRKTEHGYGEVLLDVDDIRQIQRWIKSDLNLAIKCANELCEKLLKIQNGLEE